MKIALLSTPTRTSVPNLVPPFGIMYLASWLREKKNDARIFDIAKSRQSNSAIITELQEYQPDLIAISGIITAYKYIYELIPDLKTASPNIPIVIGGHITLDNAELLLKNVGCDYTISGYGEKKIEYFVEYIQGIRDITEIPGLSYLNNGSVITNPGTIPVIPPDEIPLPAYDLIDMEYYITVETTNPALSEYLNKTKKPAPPLRTFNVLGARGCTDRCTFCVHEFEYKGFHVHSIDYIMDNIQILYDKYNVRIIGFGEDLFLYKLDQVKQLTEAMNRRFPDVYFYCSTRADYINRDLLTILEQSNCFALMYGFESGDPSVLQMLGKRMNPETNIRAFHMIRETNIVPLCSFMVGSPGETPESIQNTIAAIQRAGITEGGLFYTTPYPGSRLFRWCKEQGRIKDIESYLFTISNRDASILSVNFTPYPDIIVRMMFVLIQNSFYDARKSSGEVTDINMKDLIVKHWIIPVMFRLYFVARRIMSWFIPRYKCETIPFELNSRKTVRLSGDPR